MKGGIIAFAIYLALTFGWCRSVYQFFTSDFEASYKREIIYGVGVITGLGIVIGYMDIPDTKSN